MREGGLIKLIDNGRIGPALFGQRIDLADDFNNRNDGIIYAELDDIRRPGSFSDDVDRLAVTSWPPPELCPSRRSYACKIRYKLTGQSRVRPSDDGSRYVVGAVLGVNAGQFIGKLRRDGRDAQMHAAGLQPSKNSVFADQGRRESTDRPLAM